MNIKLAKDEVSIHAPRRYDNRFKVAADKHCSNSMTLTADHGCSNPAQMQLGQAETLASREDLSHTINQPLKTSACGH